LKIHLMGEPWEIQDVLNMLQERVPIDRCSRPTPQRGGLMSVMITILPEALDRLRDPAPERAHVLHRARLQIFDELAGDGPPPLDPSPVGSGPHCHCRIRPAPGTICGRCGGVERRVS
jgi:hypothetical protein